MELNKISFLKLENIEIDNEGIVLLGCGGDLNDWVTSFTELLYESGVAKSDSPDDTWARAYELTTTGGRNDLLLMFPNDVHMLDIGKLAIVRLKMGDMSWLSDYLVNYRDQHIELDEVD